MSRSIVSCLALGDEVIDELVRVADATSTSVAHAFCRAKDSAMASSLIAAAIVDGAVKGERRPRQLELFALQKLQHHFPALAIKART